MSTLPKHSKSAGVNKKPKNLVLSMRPCADDQTYYRFRLLAFAGINSDRDDPHICRFVHQVWGTHPEKGYPVLEDEIVCPVSPYVHVEGNKYGACKVCDVANKYFIAFKESNWKDKEAAKKNKLFGRKYQAIVPVYVVNDPNYDGNNGKFKVIIFNDKKQYQDFRSKIEKASMTNCVFNGKNAVDCCIHMGETAKIVNEGQPNEYVYKIREIDKIKFSNKPYDIPSITKETVDAMGFDETYYVESTQDEINAFYKKHCTVSNDDIPEDDEIPVYTEPKHEVKIQKTNDVKPSKVENVSVPPTTDISNSDVDSLLDDPDNEGLDQGIDTTPATSSKNEDVDANEWLDSLDI